MRIILLFLICASCFSCNPKPVQRSFYYWKNSSPGLDTFSLLKIKEMNISHFYVRYMDVDWSEQHHMPVPLEVTDSDPTRHFITANSYTPVVFITNRSFLHMSEEWCDTLAIKLALRIRRKTQATENQHNETMGAKALDSFPTLAPSERKDRFNEIQIDCDWTTATKDKYFRFLTRLRQQFPDKKLSATIRLFPYRYPQKMGVPPVDRGMLMCYNMGKIDRPETQNSVFDLNELEAYLSTNTYPLPLDLALPVFGWYAWFRGGHFKGILYQNELPNGMLNFARENTSHWRITTDLAISGKLLRAGDLLREEFPAEADLVKAAALLQKRINPKIQRITFYHWDPILIKRYEKTIQKIYNIY